jgi:hypothetical protein
MNPGMPSVRRENHAPDSEPPDDQRATSPPRGKQAMPERSVVARRMLPLAPQPERRAPVKAAGLLGSPTPLGGRYVRAVIAVIDPESGRRREMAVHVPDLAIPAHLTNTVCRLPQWHSGLSGRCPDGPGPARPHALPADRPPCATRLDVEITLDDGTTSAIVPGRARDCHLQHDVRELVRSLPATFTRIVAAHRSPELPGHTDRTPK